MKYQKTIAVFAITNNGLLLAERIVNNFVNFELIDHELSVKEKFTNCWDKYDGIIAIMSTGIVVRVIAKLIADKETDPAVIVLDENGENVISLLSGHIGGANEIAKDVANVIGGNAIVTTASDVCGKTALDLWARKNGLVIADKKSFTAIMMKLVNNGSIRVYSDIFLADIPNDFRIVSSVSDADMIISHLTVIDGRCVHLYPVNLVFGVGCNRGTSADDIELACNELCVKYHLARKSIRNLASIDLKSDEMGLLEFAGNNHWQIDFFSHTELNTVHGIEASKAVKKATGAKAVAEPAALLSAGSISRKNKLIIGKQKWKDVTLAVAKVK